MGLLITLQIMEPSDLTYPPPQNSLEVPAVMGYNEKGFLLPLKKIVLLVQGMPEGFFNHSFSQVQHN